MVGRIDFAGNKWFEVVSACWAYMSFIFAEEGFGYGLFSVGAGSEWCRDNLPAIFTALQSK